MRILIHGGFFSESSQSNETKHKKQEALLEILNQGKDFFKKTQRIRDCCLYGEIA